MFDMFPSYTTLDATKDLLLIDVGGNKYHVVQGNHKSGMVRALVSSRKVSVVHASWQVPGLVLEGMRVLCSAAGDVTKLDMGAIFQLIMHEVNTKRVSLDHEEDNAQARELLCRLFLLARAEAKKARNVAEADRIRQELASQGIELKDSPQGTTWVRA